MSNEQTQPVMSREEACKHLIYIIENSTPNENKELKLNSSKLKVIEFMNNCKPTNVYLSVEPKSLEEIEKEFIKKYCEDFTDGDETWKVVKKVCGVSIMLSVIKKACQQHAQQVTQDLQKQLEESDNVINKMEIEVLNELKNSEDLQKENEGLAEDLGRFMAMNK